MRVGPPIRAHAYWLLAALLAFGVAAGPRVEPTGDDDRGPGRAPALGWAVDPGWAALDDPAMDDPASDVEKAGLPRATAVVIGMPLLGALRRRVGRRAPADCPGASSTRGPPGLLDVRSDSRPPASSRPSACSIRGRGLPARAMLERAPAAPCCSSNRSLTQEKRS
jgi:hypothetical protein